MISVHNLSVFICYNQHHIIRCDKINNCVLCKSLNQITSKPKVKERMVSKAANLIKLILAFIWIQMSLQGCISKAVTLENELLLEQSIQVSGIQRKYHLYIPENPVNAPLVLLFHGNGGDYNAMLGLTGVKAPFKLWLEIAEKEQLIIAVPNGALGSTNSRGWNDCRADNTTNPETQDVRFIRELIDNIARKYESDTSRVFAVGTSNGGIFVQRLAEEIPNKINAFAAIIASRPVNSSCVESTVPVSALFMNGTADSIVPFEGGQVSSNRGEVFSAEETIHYWVTKNATDTIPQITPIADLNSADNSTATKYLYKNGVNNTEVAFYNILQGGHTEPSIAERYRSVFLSLVGNQNGDFEMAKELWDFFRDK